MNKPDNLTDWCMCSTRCSEERVTTKGPAPNVGRVGMPAFQGVAFLQGSGEGEGWGLAGRVLLEREEMAHAEP